MFNLSQESFGIGVDIESVTRFSTPEIAENAPLLDKVFTKKELAYCYANQLPEQHLAVRFAGKEAIIKALANITDDFIKYHDIEIINNTRGIPHARIIRKGFNHLRIHLSLSHAQGMALAFAVVIRLNKRTSKLTRS